MNKIELFEKITEGMLDTYVRKNHDYGDSFNNSLDKHGIIASVVRMEDKINRVASLAQLEERKVEETMEDTLLDLANYAIMTVMYLKEKQQ